MPFITESLDLAGRHSSTLKVTRCNRGVSSSSFFRLAFYFSHTILKKNGEDIVLLTFITYKRKVHSCYCKVVMTFLSSTRAVCHVDLNSYLHGVQESSQSSTPQNQGSAEVEIQESSG